MSLCKAAAQATTCQCSVAIAQRRMPAATADSTAASSFRKERQRKPGRSSSVMSTKSLLVSQPFKPPPFFPHRRRRHLHPCHRPLHHPSCPFSSFPPPSSPSTSLQMHQLLP